MKFISKISKQGEDYFIRIPRFRIPPASNPTINEDVESLHSNKVNLVVEVKEALE